MLVVLILAAACGGAMAQEAPAPADAAPSKSVDRSAAEALRERILKRVDDLLRERRERILEEVERVLDQELRRAEEERRAGGGGREESLDRAAAHLEKLTRSLRELQQSVERTLEQAGQALKDGGETPVRPGPEEGKPEEKTKAAAEPEIPPAFRAFKEAMSRYEAGEYERAIESFTEAAKGLVTVESPMAPVYRYESLYRISCCHAVLGHADDAFRSLERAIRGGFRHIEKMEEDAELDALREDPRFDRLIRLARSLRG